MVDTKLIVQKHIYVYTVYIYKYVCIRLARIGRLHILCKVCFVVVASCPISWCCGGLMPAGGPSHEWLAVGVSDMLQLVTFDVFSISHLDVCFPHACLVLLFCSVAASCQSSGART